MKLTELQSKITPGPWHVHGDNHTLIHADDGRQMLAEALRDHIMKGWAITLPEAQANARLIAAAPEMLEALEWCADVIGHNSCSDGQPNNGFVIALEHARAAIAKAKGK